MRLCVTYNNTTKLVVATLARVDGNPAHMLFDSSEACRAWLETLEARLEREQRIATGTR